MSAIPHQPQRHHTELQLRGRYVPIGTRLRDMCKTVREHLSGRIPAGVRLHIRYQLNGRSVIVNRNYSELKQYNRNRFLHYIIMYRIYIVSIYSARYIRLLRYKRCRCATQI